MIKVKKSVVKVEFSNLIWHAESKKKWKEVKVTNYVNIDIRASVCLFVASLNLGRLVKSLIRFSAYQTKPKPGLLSRA